MKILVVYYSRTGTTKTVAEQLSMELGAEKEEIDDYVHREGMLGYMKSGKEAMQKKSTKIKPIKKHPKNYDLVIIGTPVWAFTMSTPIRAYIEKYKDFFKKVAFFCTMGGSGDAKTFLHMKELSGIEPLVTVSYKTVDVAKKKFDTKEYIKKLKI